MSEKTCKWCYGTITLARFIKSFGYCYNCKMKWEDPGASAPSRNNRGKKVK